MFHPLAPKDKARKLAEGNEKDIERAKVHALLALAEAVEKLAERIPEPVTVSIEPFTLRGERGAQ